MNEKKITLLLLMTISSVLSSSARNTLEEHIRTRPNLSQLKSSLLDLKISDVDYGGKHPFERPLKNRNLQSLPVSNQVQYADRSSGEYEVIRIRFLVEPLVALRDQSPESSARVDLILDQILPAVRNTWVKHLDVFPASGNIPIRRNECFGLYDDTITNEMVANGVGDADLAILVSGKESLAFPNGDTLDVCGPSTLAVATTCTTDQFDRPIVGFINFCLDNLKASRRRLDTEHGEVESGQLVDAKLVATHEVAHVLGVDGDLIPLYRDENGRPRTPRPLQARTVPCVNGVTRRIVFPSMETLQLSQTSRQNLFYEVVTPRVRQVARNHYNCQSLNGARLENQPTGTSCSGSHWDERTLYTELLSPIFTGDTDILSPFTLALLEDSGWYQVQYEGAEASPFGLGAGCEFVTGDCIVNDRVPSYGEGAFCDSVSRFNPTSGLLQTSQNDVLCSPGNKGFALCDLYESNQVPSSIGTFSPNAIPYFSNPNLLSLSDQTDWCPVPKKSTGTMCTDPSTASSPRYAGEQYGPQSRCIEVDPRFGNKFPGCFNIECDAASRRVIVAGRACEFDGQEFPVSSAQGAPNAGTARCPKLAHVCPHLFCEGGCSGRGICNYETNQCECFDSSNTSPICGVKDGRVIPDNLPPIIPPGGASTNGGATSGASSIWGTALVFPLVMLMSFRM